MKNGITTINGWISVFTGLLVQLLILGIVIGILFDDKFLVIQRIGETMEIVGQNGVAGLVALVVIAAWYKKA